MTASLDREALFRQSLHYFLAPVRAPLHDPAVTEILINGPHEVFVERGVRLERTELSFPDEPWLRSLANNVAEYVGRKLDAEHHSLSGRLPAGYPEGTAGGYRVHVMTPPASRNGIAISIRKFSHQRFTLDELAAGGSLPEAAAELLRLAVEIKQNIVVSGGTGTGKTTLLNALSAAIRADERILVLEETNELKLHQPHTLYFETQQANRHGRGEVTLRDLFVDSLRMRPDRIIVGEVRRGEALDMVQSMLSGHSGALTTVHANSPADAVTRLETLCLQSDAGLPHAAARLQVTAAVNLVVQIERYGERRRIKTISECLGVDREQRPRWRRLFYTQLDDQEGVRLAASGKPPRFLRDAHAQLVARKYPLAQQWLAESRRQA